MVHLPPLILRLLICKIETGFHFLLWTTSVTDSSYVSLLPRNLAYIKRESEAAWFICQAPLWRAIQVTFSVNPDYVKSLLFSCLRYVSHVILVFACLFTISLNCIWKLIFPLWTTQSSNLLTYKLQLKSGVFWNSESCSLSKEFCKEIIGTKLNLNCVTE